jgi:histidine triad (HIT) family protein
VDHLGAEGVNLVQSTGAAAFQTVFHLHVHVVPRYTGDGLTLPWVPTPGDPSQMDAAAETLRSVLGPDAV